MPRSIHASLQTCATDDLGPTPMPSLETIPLPARIVLDLAIRESKCSHLRPGQLSQVDSRLDRIFALLWGLTWKR